MLENFEKIITELKLLVGEPIAIEVNNFEKFSTVIDEIKQLKTQECKPEFSQTNFERVSKTIKSFKSLKKQVYADRLENVRQVILENEKLFRYSPFELMEHNFRENTHSNILEYLFDYNNTEKAGRESLFLLISSLEKKGIKNLKRKLYSGNYKIKREHSVGNGRIDLLITDDVNKFAIIIENKVLATVADKEIDDEGIVIKTQLDLYKDYFLKSDKFANWELVFILLSYRNINDFHDDHFELINYETLFEVIKTAMHSDQIAKDYLTLLYGINNNLHSKKWLITERNKILNNSKNINLINFETIKNFVYGFN